MTVKLYIKENNFIKLGLISGKKEIDCLEWRDQNDLSRVLLANLDKLLRRNKMGLDLPTNFFGKGLDLSTNSLNKKHKYRNKFAKIGGGLDKISGYKIISEVPRKWTTYRITEITFKMLKIGQVRLKTRFARSASGGIQRAKLAKKNKEC